MIINYFYQGDYQYVLRSNIPLEYRAGLDIYIGHFLNERDGEQTYLKGDVEDYCEEKGLEAKFEMERLDE